jgi:hypothetical protein
VTWPAENPRLWRKYGTITPTKGSGDTLSFIMYSRIHVDSEPSSADEVVIYQAVPRPARTKFSCGGGSSALSFQDAEHLLRADECDMSHLSARPIHLSTIDKTSIGGGKIFFERQMGRAPRSGKADCWNTSGGLKGSTVWPSEGPPRVRRRYGRITQRPTVEGAVPLRFVVYSLISEAPCVAKKPQPDLEPRLFQIWSDAADPNMPRRKRTAGGALPRGAHAGAVDVTNAKREGCKLKRPSFGLPVEGNKNRWCFGCAKAHPGAVDIASAKRKCEGCKAKRSTFGINLRLMAST